MVAVTRQSLLGNVPTAALFLTAAALSTSCGGPTCGGHEGSDDPEAPVLVRADLLGQGFPDDPWTLVFVFDSTDGNGDLGAGRIEVYLGGNEDAVTQTLDTVFRQSGVPLDAHRARTWMTLRFQDTVKDGSTADLRFQLIDGAGLRSNCYSLEVRFDVENLAVRPIVQPLFARGGACRKKST